MCTSAPIKPYRNVNGINESQHFVACVKMLTIDIVFKLLIFFYSNNLYHIFPLILIVSTYANTEASEKYFAKLILNVFIIFIIAILS